MTRTEPRQQGWKALSDTAKRLRDTYSHEQLAHLLYQADLRVAHLHRVMDDMTEELARLKKELK